MRIGLFGGTFNPPHKAHIRLAKAFLKEYNLDKLYICPANNPYHKATITPTDAEHRFNMTKLAFKDMPTDKVVVSDMEIKRGGNTYTVDTVNQILSSHPEIKKVYVLCGTDMIMTLPSWYKAEELLQKSYIVHAKRKGTNSLLPPNIEISTLEFDELEISSSQIRHNLESDKMYLSKEVYEYAYKNLLYHIDTDYDIGMLKSYAETHEKTSRYLHTLAVEECALELKSHTAPHLSNNLISTCAILHDCTKNADISDHHVLFSTINTPPQKEDLSSEKLFHSRSGAILAKRMFNVSDAVYNAIWRHTVGAKNMTVLDKIIFLADYIEKTRTFSECVALRKIYYDGLKNSNTLSRRLINLDKCVKIALDSTIGELSEKGIKPHSETVKALKFIEKEIAEYESVFANI